MFDKKKFAKIFSFIASPLYLLIVFLLGRTYITTVDDIGLPISCAALYLVFFYSFIYIKKSGQSRIIPEIIYILFSASIGAMLDEVFREIRWNSVHDTYMSSNFFVSTLEVLGFLIVIFSIACRVYLYVKGSAEYNSQENKNERSVTKLKYYTKKRYNKASARLSSAEAIYEGALRQNEPYNKVKLKEQELKRAEEEFKQAEKEYNRVFRVED